MRMMWSILGLVVVGTVVAQRAPQGPMSNHRYTPEDLGYRLVWADEFEGDELDATKWAVRGIGPRAVGYVSEEAVQVGDGYLKLSAIEKDGRILIGAVGTEGRYMVRYGFFECRAQLQRSPGVWAAFWVQSSENVFYVDGFAFYEVKVGISHIPEYLILSMELPSNRAELKETVFPDDFVIDYVRVYQRTGGKGINAE